MTNPVTTDPELIAHYSAGTLLAHLRNPRDADQEAGFHSQLAGLHNSGQLDLLALTASPEFNLLSKQNYFFVVQVYGGVIPLLDASINEVLETADRFAAHPSRGGFSYLMEEATRAWMIKDIRRVREVIALAKVNPAIDLELLRTALVASADRSEIKAFLSLPDQRRRVAIAAIGAVAPISSQDTGERLAILEDIAINDASDESRFTAIFSAFGLLHTAPSLADTFISKIIASIKRRPSDETRTALLQELWRKSNLFTAAQVRSALDIICDGTIPQSIINMLSGALSHLIGGPHHDIGVDTLTDLIASDRKALPFEGFASLDHRLKGLDRKLQFSLAASWFSTGDIALCKAAAAVVGGQQNAPPFDDDLDGRGFSDSQLLVICHKAFGYMIMAPVVATSFIVAALRAKGNGIQTELVHLMQDTALMNYGDTVVKYLKTIPKGDPAYTPVQKAIKHHRAYNKGLDIPEPIKELQPSDYQRGAVRQKQYVQAKEIRKMAERQSVFWGLMQRSTLLYGRKAITYLGEVGELPRTMELKSFKAGVELPRLGTIDPVGLEYLVLLLRTSKPK